MNRLFGRLLGTMTLTVLFLLTGFDISLGQENRTIDITRDQFRVRLVPDKAAVMLGEPMFLSFIVENLSDIDLLVLSGGDYRNRLGRPEKFNVTVKDGRGNLVEKRDAGPTMGGMLASARIPAGGSHVFRLLLQHWAIIKRTGRYELTVDRVLTLGKYYEEKRGLSVPTVDIPSSADCSVEIVPQDKVRMRALIDEVGNAFLSGNWEARTSVAYIEDELIVAYLLRALDIKSSDMKFAALSSLSKFRTDAALSGIKRALNTTGNDITNTTTRELAESSAEQIRHAAAAALARSTHRDAGKALLALRRDRNEAIRNTVIQYAATLDPKVAIPVLEELASDTSEKIRNEALRYLREKFGKNQ